MENGARERSGVRPGGRGAETPDWASAGLPGWSTTPIKLGRRVDARMGWPEERPRRERVGCANYASFGYSPGMHDEDDPELGAPNTAAEPYGFHTKGFRFMCWPAVDHEDAADEYPADDNPEPVQPRYRADLFGSDPALIDAAEAAAARVTELTGHETRWRPITPNGGAGDNWIVDLVQITGTSIGTIFVLLQLPKAAREAWNTLSQLYDKLNHNSRGDDWHAGSEVAILKCIEEIRCETPDVDIVPETIRVVQDGTLTGMWGDMAAGTHVIVIPELRHRKTHVFAIDSKLIMHGRFTIPHLTADAESHAELVNSQVKM